MTFVAVLGVSGVGKTTLTNILAAEMEGVAMCEPLREDWPEFIESNFDLYAFDVLEWFRCYQVDIIRQARAYGENGLAFCDAYYHKIMIDYIDHPSSAWIIRKDDPYADALRLILEKDKQNLPNADVIIFIEADRATWSSMVNQRSGPADDLVLESAFKTQKQMLEATQALSIGQKIPLLVVQQKFNGLNDIMCQCRDFVLGFEND